MLVRRLGCLLDTQTASQEPIWLKALLDTGLVNCLNRVTSADSNLSNKTWRIGTRYADVGDLAKAGFTDLVARFKTSAGSPRKDLALFQLLGTSAPCPLVAYTAYNSDGLPLRP